MKSAKFFGALASFGSQCADARSLAAPSGVSSPRLQCKFSSVSETLWQIAYFSRGASAASPTLKVFISAAFLSLMIAN